MPRAVWFCRRNLRAVLSFCGGFFGEFSRRNQLLKGLFWLFLQRFSNRVSKGFVLLLVFKGFMGFRISLEFFFVAFPKGALKRCCVF